MTENAGMKDVIHTINQLQDVLTSTGVSLGLDLPQIAVVGGQSAGKSSVLECFVGKDFLPRGSGIVTRRPLVLQLYHHPSQEWAEFLHCGSKRFTDFHEVRREISEETDRETGQNKGISNKPINLKIFSPRVLDLTLVDLPGLTKVAVGDQPEDIEQQIKEMLYSYITQDNTIILAVTPANQDIANSDALKLARKVDPQGDRTIGVITKLDLMDDGTDARDILENRFLPLKKGYVGVVNRSQKDIDSKKDIKQAVSAEREFFLNSPYRKMAAKMGTKYLQQVLNKELSNHIQNKLPEIRAEIIKKSQEIEEDLKDLGYNEDEAGDSSRLIYRALQGFTDQVHSIIDGSGEDVNITEVTGGALINRAFYHDFNTFFNDSFGNADTLEREIGLAISNLHGFRTALFVPEQAFDKIVQILLEQYKTPAVSCVTHIRKLLDNIIEDSLASLAKYPELKKNVLSLVTSELNKNESLTSHQLQTHIEAQKAFMNTKHPDFPEEPTGVKQAKTADVEREDIEYVANTEIPEPKPANGGSQFFLSPVEEGKEQSHHFKGRLRVTQGRHPREAVCSLTRTDFTYVLAAKHFLAVEVRETIGLQQVDCHTRALEGGERLFILQRADRRPLVRDQVRLEMTASREEAESWHQAFKVTGILKEMQGDLRRMSTTTTPTSTPIKVRTRSIMKTLRVIQKEKSVTEKILSDKNLQDQSKILKTMIENYMKITDKTIRDIVPKYIVLSLVKATQTYVKKDLVSDVMKDVGTEEAKRKLLQANQEYEESINELLELRQATQKALDVFMKLF